VGAERRHARALRDGAPPRAELGFDITYGSAGGGSGANFTGAMGIATLGGLGLRGADGHTLNEHIEVDSLAERGR
jgi:glutamate carboxypeptidase